MKERMTEDRGARLIEEINTVIGGDSPADYSINRYVLHRGSSREHGSAQELAESTAHLWWVAATGNPEIQRRLELFLGAKYVSLQITPETRSKTLAALPHLLKEFLSVAQLRAEVAGLPNAPQERISKLRKSTAFIDPDTAGRFSYDIKARFGGHVGYASLNWGLVPEKTAELLGCTIEELARSTVIIAGAGGGDLAIRSLPKGGTVCAIDYSEGMVSLAKDRGLIAVQGDVSEEAVWEQLPQEFHTPDIVIADYFLDVSQKPADALRLMAHQLSAGGRLMITNLLPIDQRYGYPDESQNIGNTHNPWTDLKRLEAVCAQYGLRPRSFSVTSYLQYDIGRPEDDLPLEIRPSGILVFEKRANATQS